MVHKKNRTPSEFGKREREKNKEKHYDNLLLPHVIRSEGYGKRHQTADLGKLLPSVYIPEADAS